MAKKNSKKEIENLKVESATNQTRLQNIKDELKKLKERKDQLNENKKELCRRAACELDLFKRTELSTVTR